MKFFIILFLICLPVFSAFQPMQTISGVGTVGDVRSSLLTEAQFQAKVGSGWVLCDGRDITGSSLAQLTGNNTLMDARGQFLRGKNNGRSDGNQDPDGERAVGSFQAESIGPHDHRNDVEGTPNEPFPGQGLDFAGGRNDGFGGRTENFGNGIGNETRPKNVVVNYFCKIN